LDCRRKKNVKIAQMGANGHKRQTGIAFSLKLEPQLSCSAHLERAMNVLIVIELIVGVLFVMLFGIAEIARDLSQHSYQPSPDGDDDDDIGVGSSATGDPRPSSSMPHG
jgi:hypothetical protein